jgi:hypothetical protein
MTIVAMGMFLQLVELRPDIRKPPFQASRPALDFVWSSLRRRRPFVQYLDFSD